MTDREVYERVSHDLTRFATAMVGRDDAADVVSTVVTKALGRRGGLAGLRDPRTYLMTAVHNEASGLKRQRARRNTIPVANPVVESSIGDDSDTMSITALVETLPARQRAAAFLVFYEEHTPTEAAEIMGCRPGTVRRYLHLARERLRETMDHG
ncbi:MAG: RNA polymerase sigma factor [Acidimicrobiia bacterium]